MPRDVLIRPLQPDDSFEHLTRLLHAAYAELEAIGMRYLATHQTADVTRERALRGECYVALIENEIVGSITYYDQSQTLGSPWYDRHDVASLGQFAVHPAHRNKGIGSHLLALAEQRARDCRAAEIALDTAEGASHLIRFYRDRGYRIVEYAQWEHANYRSVVMSKSLM